MFELDHVAIQTNNIAESVTFYIERFRAQVLYRDATWAMLRVGPGKLALVSPYQHPPHVALRVTEEILETEAARAKLPIDRHRDGTIGIYVDDTQGNVIELICYPPGQTVYEKTNVDNL